MINYKVLSYLNKMNKFAEMQSEMDIYGYETSYFYICPGAVGTFNHLINEMNITDDRDLYDQFGKMVETLGSGPSVLDNRHIKEGVCVRIEGGINNKTFKFKSFEFKVLEGIVKDSGVVDAEEAQG